MRSPPASVPKRRDALEKRVAIERAAIELVLERGYDNVTVDMICQLAGVSQRTFFNHFTTKDAALLGPAPHIDEHAARAFLVSTGPLLLEVTQLVRYGDVATEDDELLPLRVRAITSHPMLTARQMERLSAISAELTEIIRLRLSTQGTGHSPEELAAEAEIITHIAGGVMRYIVTSWARDAQTGNPRRPDRDQLARTLSRALARLT